MTPGSSMNHSIQTPARPGLTGPKPGLAPALLSRRAVPAFAVFALMAVLGLAGPRLHAQSANFLYKSGQNAEARENYDAAFDFYQKANAKNPKELTYRAALYRIRVTASAAHMTKGHKLLQSGDEQGALAEFMHAAEIDPGNQAAEQEIARIRSKNGQAAPASEADLPEPTGEQQEIDTIGSPPELKPMTSEPLTLHMTEDAKVVYQAIGKAAGVNVLFDPDYNSKRMQVDLNNVSLLDALRIVGTMSGTFWRPVTANTIFVAQNTRIKRTELDEQAVQTFYLTNAWQQNDLNDVQTALRNVLTGAKIYGVASQNAIVMRGTPDELLLAQKLINDLDKARAEVVVDIAVLEVSKNWERTLGIAWPSSVGVALQPPTSSTSSTSSTTSTTGSTTTSTSPTLYDLAHLKATNFAVTVGSATLNLLLTDSNTKVLQSPRIRATDSQKATMKIGSRIPIATGSYQTGAATAVVSSLVNTQFQYQDVGVNIEMTPTVHFDHDVTLKIKIEVTSQSGSVTISGVTEPILSQRVVDQVIRLREGEASILGGIQDKQDQTSWTGFPGLSSIPILKYLFGSKDQTVNDDELVFLVVPHVVRSQSLEAVNLRTVDTGEGTSVEIRRVPSENPGPNPVSGPGPNPAPNPGPNPAPGTARPPYPLHPPASPRSSVGTVPGQSAMAAGPAALDQIHKLGETAGDPTPAAAPPASPPAAGVSLTLNAPPGPVPAGTTFSVPVVLTGGTDIAAVPVRISYDPAKLSLVNVDKGDFLGRDGQAWDLSHRDDPPGLIVINAERTGTTGISGTGEVFVLSFRARAAGESTIEITHPGAVNSTRQQVPAQGGRISVQVK